MSRLCKLLESYDDELAVDYPNCALVKEYDGVVQSSSIDKPLYKGNYKECVEFIRKMPNKDYNKLTSGKNDIAMIDLRTKRLISYSV